MDTQGNACEARPFSSLRTVVHLTGLRVLVILSSDALLLIVLLLVQPFLRVDLKFAGVEIDRVECVTAFRSCDTAGVAALDTEVIAKVFFNSADPVSRVGEIGTQVCRRVVAFVEDV